MSGTQAPVLLFHLSAQAAVASTVTGVSQFSLSSFVYSLLFHDFVPPPCSERERADGITVT